MSSRTGDGPVDSRSGLLVRPARALRPVADHSYLIECADLADAVAVHAALIEQGYRGVGGATTVLVRSAERTRLEAALTRIPRGSLAGQPGREISVDVVYDGEDLHELAETLGLSADGLIAWHTAAPWTAAFAGFAPGFLYCARTFEAGAAGAGSSETPELPEALVGVPQIPRRSTPRTAVPAGSVALAGQFSAVYPRSSPGGWQLIGRTATPMVDLRQDPPALLAPGDRIAYRPVREAVELRPDDEDTGDLEQDGLEAPPDPAHHLVLETAGLQSLIQDRGRPGRASAGISSSGAADRAASARAAHLVGNAPAAAGLECLLGGVVLRAVGDQVLAVTGAETDLEIAAEDVGESGSAWRPRMDLPFALRDGEHLRIGAPSSGLRVYVAVRGGVEAPAVLGSRASDTLAGLGPRQLVDGDALAVGADPGTAVDWPLEIAGASAPGVSARNDDEPLPVRVVLGPRQDWFTAASVASFLAQSWTVSGTSDRVGVRLEGEALGRSEDRELPSEGTVPGSIQVPASGLPVVFLRDHPVTGGYPVIATVVAADLDLLAQAAPATALRFVAMDSDGRPEDPSRSTS